MQVTYENVKFTLKLSRSIERHLLKLRIKKMIGRFIGKPYRPDSYLVYARKLLQKISNPIVVDIGANIGITALPLAKEFPNAQIYAVEPHPIPAACFIENALSNQISNVHLTCSAIAPSQDLVRIYTCPSNSGGHRITGFTGRTDYVKPATLDHITLKSLTLKELFLHFAIPHCHLLKIDVEGFEYQVLESLEDFLTPSKIKAVVAEYGPEGMRAAGRSAADMVSLMLKKGFACQELGTGVKIQSTRDIPLVKDLHVTDFLFTAL